MIHAGGLLIPSPTIATLFLIAASAPDLLFGQGELQQSIE
jgi:hypothetical protein